MVLWSEYCLYLNVTMPTPKPAGQKRPVLVWMHGGAFLGGSGSDYSTEQLAVRGDTVVVTVNYRLGIFGYFGHPGLGSAPPFGLADQQAALRWVRANAERFGGDPGSVTLFGESAGALSICAHLTSPTAVGLFQRAVLQSGSCLMSFPRGALGPGMPAYEPFASESDVQTAGAEAARQLGCTAGGGDEVLACLRGQSTDRLATAQLMQSFNRPAFGNALLPVAPGQALASGHFHRVPVIQGFEIEGPTRWFRGHVRVDQSSSSGGVLPSVRGQLCRQSPLFRLEGCPGVVSDQTDQPPRYFEGFEMTRTVEPRIGHASCGFRTNAGERCPPVIGDL
ncbi:MULTISPECIES: carboxylesterase family protein [Streptomyces]|uniref:carboxylesterase family protein n=1 Tax=Streptomyces TaxID=1883 RepID=UPI0022B06CAF|nr:MULTISPECIES: carboxylesterase family protein [Streptomyces]MCZ4102480.1 carboxylesterase family protein [Streptomyces sp. H39-C1]